ncbi:MAG: PKD domain-containing protein [Methanoregula sp.]|uniref:glycine-rich domain-containing protein n=1 Tax=Methanoregula sp. TaxID=2052170 RepID=UPI003BD355A2
MEGNLIATLAIWIFLAGCLFTVCVQSVSAVTWTSANGCWTATNGNQNLIMWNATGSSSWTVPTGLSNLSVLVVAGGASGGGSSNASATCGGGGGGGGAVYAVSYAVTGGSLLNLFVGSGGTGGAANASHGVNGMNSSFNTILTIGGGWGASATSSTAGGSGGSGGGGTHGGAGGATTQASLGSSGGGTAYGFAGGTASGVTRFGAGGGGGAGAKGGTGTTTAGGAGGAGVSNSITGSAIFYGAGGGGGGNTTAGAGGSVIGGTGGTNTTFPTAATASTGSGGGGGGYENTTAGGSGASGVIIVSYTKLPVVSFTMNVTSGFSPLAVSFNDTSNPAGTAFQWGFNNVTGNNTWTNFATTQNPVWTFGIGNYSVNLTEKNLGGSNTFKNATFINVTAGSIPVANFIANVTSGVDPLIVMFNDTSTNSPTQWNVSFGDGGWYNATTFPATNITHTYSGGSNYTVTWKVANVYGSSSKIGYVQLYHQTVSGFTGTPTSGIFPFTVQFNLTSVNNNATWVNWTWGDGQFTNTSTIYTFNATHVYSSEGTFYVTESASNPYYSNSTTQLNYITSNAYAALILNESTILLNPMTPGLSATNGSLGITVTANEGGWTISISDNTGRTSRKGYLGNYSAGIYFTYPLNTTLSSPLQLAGTTNSTGSVTTGQNATTPIYSGSLLYSGSGAVTNQLLTPNIFTQPVAYADPILPNPDTYRIDLTFTLTYP